MNFVLIGKGPILFSLALKIKEYSYLNIDMISWENRSNDKKDLHLFENLKKKFKIIKVKNINQSSGIKLIKNDIDYILSVNNTQIFNKRFVKIFKNKIINYHYSLIPSYKGLYSCTKVILKNEKYTGITWHIVTNKIDNGPIVFQKKIMIKKNENASSLIIRLNAECIKTFIEFIKNLKKKRFTKNNKKIKDFRLYLKKDKYTTIRTTMHSKKILQTFKAFDYYPFTSPLPKLKIFLDKFFKINIINQIKKPNKKFAKFLKINKNEYLIKTLDNKYLKINVCNN